jgi:hypothetical protein
VNSCLRALRRVLRLAVDWGLLQSRPKLTFLSGENRRERVITLKEEATYPSVATPLLHDVSLLLFDTGMRPKESHRVGWDNIHWQAGRNGAVLIPRGKTRAARRTLPLTPRVRASSNAVGTWLDDQKKAGCGLRRPRKGTSITTV